MSGGMGPTAPIPMMGMMPMHHSYMTSMLGSSRDYIENNINGENGIDSSTGMWINHHFWEDTHMHNGEPGHSIDETHSHMGNGLMGSDANEGELMESFPFQSQSGKPQKFHHFINKVLLFGSNKPISNLQ